MRGKLHARCNGRSEARLFAGFRIVPDAEQGPNWDSAPEYRRRATPSGSLKVPKVGALMRRWPREPRWLDHRRGDLRSRGEGTRGLSERLDLDGARRHSVFARPGAQGARGCRQRRASRRPRCWHKRSRTPGARARRTRHSRWLHVGGPGRASAHFPVGGRSPVDQLQGNAVYHFGPTSARLKPFAFAGLGATFFSAADLQSETKFSWGFGGGVKYFPWEGRGFRVHFRYKPTALNDEDAGDLCDPFGFCQSTLQQVEFAAGAVIRF